MNTLNIIEEHGFRVFPEVLLPHETRRLVDDLDQSPLRRSKAGVRHALRHPSVAALAREPRLLNIAQEVLGAEARPFRATLFDKSPQANWLVVWHQDTALPLRERHDTPSWGPWSVKDGVVYAHAPASVLRQVLALRIHLDDSTAHNGPLRVLPGTHTEGVLSDDAIHEFAAQAEPTDCLVPQGGVLAMRPLLIHSSSKSQSAVLRRVLHIEYSASMTVGEGLELAVA
jgi:ectoine hydroxylase-related dioxygenase (phytanoyl-CoA dioxygenase family)